MRDPLQRKRVVAMRDTLFGRLAEAGTLDVPFPVRAAIRSTSGARSEEMTFGRREGGRRSASDGWDAGPHPSGGPQ